MIIEPYIPKHDIVPNIKVVFILKKFGSLSIFFIMLKNTNPSEPNPMNKNIPEQIIKFINMLFSFRKTLIHQDYYLFGH